MRKAAQASQTYELHPDKILPVSIAFLSKARLHINWLEEEGPYMHGGSWLSKSEPWEDQGQWPESKGNWYLFSGDQLEYTAHSEKELGQHLLDKVYRIGSKSDEELRQDKYHKALLD